MHSPTTCRSSGALGYELEGSEKLLGQYLVYLDAHEEQIITVKNAAGWATLPAAGKDWHWWAFRLSVVRGFARYLHALEEAQEVPRPRMCFPTASTGRFPISTPSRRFSR